jgi:hypothetical protein
VTKSRRHVEPPDVSSLVAPLLHAGERVQSWHQERADRLDVFVMEHDPEVQVIIDKFGLGGGGRALQFAYKGGRWAFVGEGVWRS